jgi:pectate lyase
MNSTAGSITYQGLTLTARLKIESSTSITYTTTAASTLTLVFDSTFSGSIKVNSVSYQATNGIVTVSVPAGSNNISKDAVGNLYYISTKFNTGTLRIAPTKEAATKLAIYPNPVTTTLYLSDPEQKIEKIILYNIAGTVVKSIGNNIENIDMSTLTSGSYIIKLIAKDGSSTS